MENVGITEVILISGGLLFANKTKRFLADERRVIGMGAPRVINIQDEGTGQKRAADQERRQKKGKRKKKGRDDVVTAKSKSNHAM